ncbi:helix-turn-helix transcriptional regulator [Rhizobium sp. YJ-22]|uniref:helix-turn-helix transcriptional regulator n=1 Tax=Rhizobium sp. YJ-22 TaxID=3037556 RepID=UPI0024125D41|nr:helix-turn-helix transcriptional regulator [Rhizobium sp. YJ-22]MDG3579019.1 helix-turn-helix transcriptional regulator [Rhizobium sp. YJ-22]
MELLDAIEPVGEMVSLIGSRDFGAGFYRIANELIGIDHCTVFMCANDNPRTLVAEANCEKTAARVRSLADIYIREAYVQDPVWGTFQSAPHAGCSTFLLSPTELADEGYRREFYDKPNIKHELALTTVINGDRIYAGFYRENGRPHFSDRSAELLKYCGRTIMQVLHKHAEISLLTGPVQAEPKPVSQKALLERVRSAIMADSGLITAREAEICASIVLGYTVLGISMNLGISVNTVATHRKRAYAKLRVCSQNELFARYFSVVETNLRALRYN